MENEAVKHRGSTTVARHQGALYHTHHREEFTNKDKYFLDTF